MKYLLLICLIGLTVLTRNSQSFKIPFIIEPGQYAGMDLPFYRAIGSHINTYIRPGVDGRIVLLSWCEKVPGAGFSHSSNGKTKSPSLAKNAGSFSPGLNYSFNDNAQVVTQPEIPELRGKNV